MKKLLTLLLAFVSVAALAGCNTIDGMGEDMEDAGESMQDASN